MICRILGVVGVLLVSVLAYSILTEGVAHAQEQSSPTLPNSDVRLQADIVFWQTIMDSEDHRDFKDYLEQFPDGQFVALAHRRHQAEIVAYGRVLQRMAGERAMNIAAYSDDIDILEWLKTKGADINAPDSDGLTPMHSAALSNAVEVMEWLKAQGADVNARDSDGLTPMHHAEANNAVDATEWLRKNGGGK